MCFYKSTNSRYNTVKIATKDIVCYKILDNYTDGYYSTAFGVKYFGKNVIKPVIKKSKFELDHTYCFELGEGLHTISNKRSGLIGWRMYDRSLFKSYIPVGTKYYYNPKRHEYISEKLIVTPEIIKR